MQVNKNQPAPLSADLELRRPGNEAVEVNRFLQPRMEKYIDQLDNSLSRLGELATMAKRAKNFSAEAALHAKFVDQILKVLKLMRSESLKNGAYKRSSPLTNDEIPRWDSIPLSVRANFEKALPDLKRAGILPED